MSEERATGGSESDPTLDPVWLDQNTDRLLNWDLMRQFVFNGMEPVSPRVVADRIGESRNIVYETIKRARKHTDHALKEILADAD
jgi:transposase-like protein